MHATAPPGRDRARAARGEAAGSPLRALHAVTGLRAALCTLRPTGKPVTMNIFPFQYAFNLFSHNSPMTDNGYNEEEMKLVGSLGEACPRPRGPPDRRPRGDLACQADVVTRAPLPPAPAAAGQGDAQDLGRDRRGHHGHVHPRAHHARARRVHQPGV